MPRSILSREAARRLDRLALERYAIPSIVLMENAAIGCARVAMEMLAGRANPSAVIVCGPGNNGGDGYAIARHLHNAGWRVSAIPLAEPTSPDAQTNHEIARRMGLVDDAQTRPPQEVLDRARERWRGVDLVIDAIVGTGLSRPLEGAALAWVEAINAARGWTPESPRVLAIDVPSGLDADRGPVLGPCVRADVTATMAAWKPAFLRVDATAMCGQIEVVHISVPRVLLDECVVGA